MDAVQVPEWHIKRFDFCEVKTDAAVGSFSGHAATYRRDRQGDKVIPGAFAQSIKDTRGQLPLLFQHDIYSMPLGFTTSLAEDGKGLLMNGLLVTSTTAGRDAFEFVKAAAAADFPVSMSIGFFATDVDMDPDGSRLLKAIDLVEISLTLFPAQYGTAMELASVRQTEKNLRDAGFSRTESKLFIRLLSERTGPSRGTPDADNSLVRVLRELVADPLGA